MNDFFIGYNWPQPPGLLRGVKCAAIGLGLGVIGLSGSLAVGHTPLDGGLFEFGTLQTVTGTIVETPYPMLQHDDDARPWSLLVARGKHGANDAVRGLDGLRVEVQATRIARGDHTMFEIAEDPVVRGVSSMRDSSSATSPGTDSSPAARPSVSGRVRLRGEIVDSKCFLGVMVPGTGTTHRDCASLCLRGGIPPALFVHEADGTSSLLLLVGPDPRLRERAVALAGEPVELTGTIEQRGGWRAVVSNPDDWRRVAR